MEDNNYLCTRIHTYDSTIECIVYCPSKFTVLKSQSYANLFKADYEARISTLQDMIAVKLGIGVNNVGVYASENETHFLSFYTPEELEDTAIDLR